jgi:hypothetical protein
MMKYPFERAAGSANRCRQLSPISHSPGAPMNNLPAVSLEMFCSQDRPELSRPFSIGAWTYASDGYVLVRVPRRDDVSERAAPDASRLFPDDAPKPRYRPAPKFTIPETIQREEKCWYCRGTGKKHGERCPTCQCEDCTSCSGTGRLTKLETVKIGYAVFQARYISWLQSLPNLEVAKHRGGIEPLRFRFDGGEGLLMPCRV